MRKIIFGTDWFTDCDDAVALRLVCRYVRSKKIELLGIGINACIEDSVASLKGFLSAEGIDGIPIGIDFDAVDYEGTPTYQKRLANICPSVSNSDAEDAVRMYRRLLANANDCVEIIEVGYPQILSELLKSSPDDISKKNGVELVSEKVSKFWLMAGKWDGDGEKEHNFCHSHRSRKAGKEFCELCPVGVTFLGWEIGYGVITGGSLNENDHLKKVLVDYGSENGRHSWDPMLTLLALIGDEKRAGYSTVSGKASVDESTGANFFEKDINGQHKFVVKMYENDYYEQQINILL